MTRYNKEFREQALKLSDEIGIKKASEQLGVLYSTIADWRKNRAKGNKLSPVENASLLTEREKQLIKENQELKQANEILKDALGFFAKDRKK
jgi:transposase